MLSRDVFNTCSFQDNLLFYICSVDGLDQILDFFCLYVYFHIHKHNERSIALNFETTLACVLLCLTILTFLASLCLSYVPTDNVSLAMNIWQRIFNKVCAFTQGKDFVK